MSEDQEFDPFDLHQEIESVQKEFNKRFSPLPPNATPDQVRNAHNRLVSEIGGTLFSVLRDMAFQQGQLFVQGAGGDDEEPEEGIEPDTAKAFSDVLTFAEHTIGESLKAQLNDEQRATLEQLQQACGVCRSWLADNTFEDDPAADEEPAEDVEQQQ